MILESLYFALPIYFANMAPVIFKQVPILATPIDGGVVWRGKRLLGKNKTWRGLVVGIIVGIMTIYLQQCLYKTTDLFRSLSLLNYPGISAPLFGSLLGGGALVGDALKSFFKRRIGILSGQKWIPFDQIDLIIGGIALGSFIYFPGWKLVLVLLILTPGLHLLTNVIAYKLGLKNVPW